MIFSRWLPEPVVSPPDEALPLLVPAPENVGGRSRYETRPMGDLDGPRPSIRGEAPNERGDGAVPPSEISPSQLPRNPSGLGGPGPVVILLHGTRRFSKHLRWDRGYPRPRGGRHLAKNIRRRPLTLEEFADRWGSKEASSVDAQLRVLMEKFEQVRKP